MNMSEQRQSNSMHHLSRRKVLAGTGVGLAAALTSTSSLASDVPSEHRYIDAHVHVWTPDTEKYPLDSQYTKASMKPESFTPQQLLKLANASNVGRVVLIQMSFYRFDNSYMLAAIADHPGVFSGVAIINPEQNQRQAMRKLKAQGVRGFRIASRQKEQSQWLAGDSMHKMWSFAADENLAICPLINPAYLPSVDRMCERFPETTVVLDHFARVGIDGTIRTDELEQLCRLARHKNVYVKTSAFYALGKKQAPYTDLGPMIAKCKDAFGCERLMWATDCPFQVQSGHTYHESIDLIREGLGFLTEEDKSWMLQKTAEGVFFEGIPS